ncbi:uncharacterized protein LOC126765268 [Bactrocera neohumeralis]|uniref:uncharacterized protein LOC120769061 n=1 Tax=Bactrocera tryoni TaxID=59916 RepID=UPI001A963643|nr:uncharacterized protein LOC120769061 [Bactrocera tryoni]XP_050338931.1 uncharacterized protein LOC126765268 [Bactrocera neohumeralis]
MLMKKLPAYRPQCCITPLAVAAEHMCFFPELRSQYSKLLERYQCMVTKNKRIWALAEPRRQTGKYLTPCFCPEIGNRKVEIVRDDMPSRTRTEQLAFPPVIRLMQLKERDSFKSFSNQRKSTVNRMLRKSMLSLYSRLSNKQPPTKKEKPKKLTDAEETLRQERLKKLAKPRVDINKEEEKKEKAAKLEKLEKAKQQKIPKGYGFMVKPKGAGSALRRFKNLSKPRQYESDEPKEWVLTNNMKYYTPSDRILKISKPRMYEVFDPEEVYRVKETALNYRATQRIRELASPPVYQHKPEVKEAPFKTSPNALKAKTSQRIVELAAPKDYFDKHTRANPYKVSPNALRARITPRLRELAKPKTYML